MYVGFFHHFQGLIQLEVDKAVTSHSQLKQVFTRSATGLSWICQHSGWVHSGQRHRAACLFEKQSSGGHQHNMRNAMSLLRYSVRQALSVFTESIISLHQPTPVCNDCDGCWPSIIILTRIASAS
jgi:hypothetical protein